MKIEGKSEQGTAESIHMLQPSGSPEGRRIRYKCGLNSSAQYQERRFLHVFRLNNIRMQRGQKRYAFRFVQSEGGLALDMKYQAIPSGRPVRTMSAALLYSIIGHRCFSLCSPGLKAECDTKDTAEKTNEKGAEN